MQHEEAAELFLQVHEGYRLLLRQSPVEREEADRHCSEEVAKAKLRDRSEEAYQQYSNSKKMLEL